MQFPLSLNTDRRGALRGLARIGLALLTIGAAGALRSAPAHADACVDNIRCYAQVDTKVSGTNGFHAASLQMAPICEAVGSPTVNFVLQALWVEAPAQSNRFLEAGIRWGLGGNGGVVNGFYYGWVANDGTITFFPTGVTPLFGNYYNVSISWVTSSSWSITVPGHNGSVSTGINAPAQELTTGMETTSANTQGWGASRMLAYVTRQNVAHDGWDTSTGTTMLQEIPSSTYMDALWISTNHHLHYKTVPSC